jgi:hypothetical protein
VISGRLHLLLPALVLMASGAAFLGGTPARAQLSELGTAADYAGLVLDPGSAFVISKSSTVVTGNVGLGDASASLNFSGGAVITGNLDDAGPSSNTSISGGSGFTGTLTYNNGSLSQAVQAAQNAASYYGGLSPTQTLSTITGGTLSGNGGLNVIDVTGGISLSRTTLTISGGAGDNFVINVTGGMNLSRSDISLCGVSPGQVVFNLIGGGTVLTTSGDSNTAGIFLAENGAINLSGGTHDSEFISGGDLTWQSGVNITQGASGSALSPVPELSAWTMTAGGLAVLLALAWLRPGPARRKDLLAA